jgi:hypothetical protein
VSLADLLSGTDATLSALSAHLDSLSAAGRVEEVCRFPRELQPRLYQLCAGGPPLTLDELVPKSQPDGVPVVYLGRNSMPLFRYVEKPMARVGDAVVGYNVQPWSWLTGPGYFTAVPSGGEVIIDYTRVPTAVPSREGHPWPDPRSNARGFSYVVFRNLHDYCRRVSRDVFIGRATRLGRPMPQHFLVART